MARLSNKKRDEKKAHGKSLYIKGMSLQSISDIIEISLTSLKNWRKEGDWDDAKKANNISIRELKNEILETFRALKEGEKPRMTADQVSKIASAFDKISDNKKQLAYMIEAFEMLSEELANEVQVGNKDERDFKLASFKHVHTVMDKLTSELIKDVI